MKIKKWLLPCEFDHAEDEKSLLEMGGRALDQAKWFLDTVLFGGEDGRTYTGTVEFVISEADPEYVKDMLDGQQEQEEEASQQ